MSKPPASPNTRRCAKCSGPMPAPTPGAKLLTERWPHFPFCSDRCRLLDLGRWMSGDYAIPGTPIDPEDPPRGLPRSDELP